MPILSVAMVNGSCEKHYRRNQMENKTATSALAEWSRGEYQHPFETGFSPFQIKGQDELDKLLWFYATASSEELKTDSGIRALNYLVDHRGWGK